MEKTKEGGKGWREVSRNETHTAWPQIQTAHQLPHKGDTPTPSPGLTLREDLGLEPFAEDQVFQVVEGLERFGELRKIPKWESGMSSKVHNCIDLYLPPPPTHPKASPPN